ncbi:hypothetical protein [Paraburkholderia acidiphila]|uniref:Uncharacterized protein n=1 Tax=Paraburkholderia acidiphila TaxID=2571747 RepID=A0A7Z2G7M2_9BURK|nr:hypothetical protein [Paraburkholderia acidiphila]QGZ56712.1 hypothetical protein FAZ97_17250 [Paraburkholderia acidiphila]
MKTIFIFNDSRHTDLSTHMTALGEDGRRVATIVFDRNTEPHYEYAFGCKHELGANVDASISIPVNDTRRDLFASYDRMYGAGNWMPLLIQPGADNVEWRHALELYRARAETVGASEPRFSVAALLRIFDAVLGTPAAPAPSADRVVH